MQHDMPAPTPAHERLTTAMAGDWHAEERMHPSPWDPKGGERRGRSHARVALGGLFLLVDYVQEQDGRPALHGHGVYGYDPRRERYTMQWWDTLSTTGGDLVEGTWLGDTLTFETRGHGPASRYVYEFLRPDAYRFAIRLAADDGWTTLMDGIYRRAPR